MSYLEANKTALDKFSKDMGDVRERLDRDPSLISYIRTLGYVCASCGKNAITLPILEYFNFRPDARCYECQRNNK